MATDLTAWLDEREREARAATPGPWAQNEPDELAHQVYKDHADGPSVLSYEGLALTNYRRDATHIAAWSPDTALRVLRVLRAAQAIKSDFKGLMPPVQFLRTPMVAVQKKLLAELLDAVDAIPG